MMKLFPAPGSHTEALLSILPERAEPSDRSIVLVIDADPTTAAALRTQLPLSEAEIIAAASIESAREALALSPATLIVCDPVVAGADARSFLERVVEHAATSGAAVVAVAGGGAAAEAELYAAGADAVLSRPVQASTLVALVRSQLRKLAAQRRRLLQDPVTGCPNLSIFRDAFQRAVHLAAREHEPLSLLVLYLPGLRALRLDRGTAAADAALLTVAGTIRDTLRKSDLLARGNGDSFLVLLPNTETDGARRVIEKTYYRLQRAAAADPAGVGAALPLYAGTAQTVEREAFERVFEQALEDLHPAAELEEQAYAGGATTGTAAAPRVVIAEDDPLTASLIRHRLERSGCEVLHVPDGSALLRIAPEVEPALLILDVKMPYVDGFEALQRLRSMRALRKTPVLMLTSMGNETDIARGFELGADDYMVKPISLVELQARVQRLLRREP
jgi:diguanylate cyclase (GGDEF)-like protein